MSGPIQMLESYYQAWSSRNPQSVLSFFDENATFEDLAFEAKFVGREQIRSFVDLTFAGVPDFRVVPSKILCDQTSLAAEWVMSGTHSGDMPGLPATGSPFSIRASSFVILNDERIEFITDYWNMNSFRRMVGLEG